MSVKPISVLVAFALFTSSTAVLISHAEPTGLLEGTLSHICSVISDQIPFLCVLPQSCFLWPSFILCWPLSCLSLLLYALVAFINLSGYALMLVLSFLLARSGRPMMCVAFIPTITASMSSLCGYLLTYPAMQASCLSACPCLPCALFVAPFTLIQSCLSLPLILAPLILSLPVPLYYSRIFPELAQLRQRLSEEDPFFASPFFGPISYNCEHIPSFIEQPAFWWQFLLCCHPEQLIALPVCLLSSLCPPVCFLITIPAFMLNLCLQLPMFMRLARRIRQNLPALASPQNTCLPTYPGFF